MFTGKTVLITGGLKGIGRAIAEKFAERHATVFTLDISDDSDLDFPGKWFHGDVSRSVDVENFVKQAKDETGRIDVLVNNAGIIRDGAIWHLSEEDFDQVLNVNLKGAWLMSKTVTPILREQRYGRIVNIASRAWLGNFGQSNYSASKGGIVSLTRVLALELASRNVTVNTVAPGLIDTELTQNLEPDGYQQLVNKQPGKKAGKPEDVAAAVVFLASPEAQFITGQCLYVDGGRSIGAG